MKKQIFSMLKMLPLVVAAFAIGQAAAQTATGTIGGAIVDPQGATVAGAKIGIRNEATGVHRESLSNSEGLFLVPALLPGSYELTVEASGFRPEIRKKIGLRVDQQLRLAISLQLGAVSDAVTVTDTSSQLQTENASLGQVVDNRSIVDLPLNGRQFLQLASLAPGVSTGAAHGPRIAGMRGAVSNISVNGIRAEYNNYLLDGTTNIDGAYNLISTSPSVESLQEFKIQTSAYSAEYGRSVGAHINAVTKSGTNDWHGSAYDFLRNDALDARHYFSLANQKKPPYRQNQFGASIGGPVLIPKLYNGRNRTFFFFNYEGLRIRQAQSLVSNVPTSPLRDGDYSGLGVAIYDPLSSGTGSVRTPFAGAIVPRARQNAAALRMQEYFPLPNAASGLVNNYVSSRSQRTDSDQYTARLDQQFSSRDSLFARYILTREVSFTPGRFPALGRNSTVRPQNGSTTYSHIFSPNLLNEFKLGYVRQEVTDFNNHANVLDVAKDVGIQGLDPAPRAWGVPAMAVAGFSSTADSAPNNQANNTYQLINNTNWNRGKHSVRFGVELRRFQFNLYSLQVPSNYVFDGQYTRNLQTNREGYSYADFLLGATRRADRSLGDTQSYFRRNSHNFYYQHDWRLHPRLMLNIGLRYELAMPFTELRDSMISADPQPNGIVLVRAGKGDPYEGFPSARFDPAIRYVRDGRFGDKAVTKLDANNWAPRFGLSWDPTGAGLWSIRAGFGVFFTEDFAGPIFDMARNAPKAIRQAIDADPVRPNIRLEQAFGDPTDPLTIPRIFSMQYDHPSIYILQWSMVVQRQLPANWLIETGYSGNGGHKLSVFQLLNLAAPGPLAPQPRRFPSPELSTVSPIAPLSNSNYHSGRLRIEKRYSQGLSAIFAYTFSKAIDDGAEREGTGLSGSAQIESRRDLERATSDYDTRHVVNLGTTYDLPSGRLWKPLFGGWQVAAIGSYLSGNRFTVSSNANLNTGVATLRPNVVLGQDPVLPEGRRGPAQWINTAAFVNPAPFVFGTAGRNTVQPPSSLNFDISVLKNLNIAEHHRLQFRAESFNVANHVNLGKPASVLGVNGFGAISSAKPARQVQFGLKYIF